MNATGTKEMRMFISIYETRKQYSYAEKWLYITCISSIVFIEQVFQFR